MNEVSLDSVDQVESWNVREKFHELKVLFLDYFCPPAQITGKRSFHLTPLFLEQFIGRALFIQNTPLPPKYQHYEAVVKKVGVALNPAFEYVVLNSWNLEARHFPNGKIGISLGLMNAFENDTRDFNLPPLLIEDKVATVLSHEIVHVAARHFTHTMELKMYFAALVKCASYALTYFTDYYYDHSINDPTKRDAVKSQLNTKIEAHSNSASLFILSGIGECTTWDQELDADKYGIELSRSSFNPQAALWIQEFFINQKQRPNNSLFSYLTTTLPSHEHRLSLLQQIVSY